MLVEIEGVGLVEMPDDTSPGTIGLYARTILAQVEGADIPGDNAQMSEVRVPLGQSIKSSIARGLEASPAGRLIGASPAVFGSPEMPTRGDRLSRTIEGVSSIMDPISLASFSVGGPAGRAAGGLVKGVGGRILGAGVGGAAALGTHGLTAEGAKQISEGDLNVGRLAAETGKGILTGAALGPVGAVPGGRTLGAEMASGAAKLLAEVGVFGTVAPALEGEKPSVDSYLDALAFLAMLRGTLGISGKISKRGEIKSEVVDDLVPAGMRDMVSGRDVSPEALDKAILQIETKVRELGAPPKQIEAPKRGGAPSAESLMELTKAQLRKLGDRYGLLFAQKVSKPEMVKRIREKAGVPRPLDTAMELPGQLAPVPGSEVPAYGAYPPEITGRRAAAADATLTGPGELGDAIRARDAARKAAGLTDDPGVYPFEGPPEVDFMRPPRPGEARGDELKRMRRLGYFDRPKGGLKKKPPVDNKGFLDVGMVKDLGEAIKALLDRPPVAYRNLHEAVRDNRSKRNLANLNAKKMHDAAVNLVPDVQLRRDISRHIETGLGGPEAAEASKVFTDAIDAGFEMALASGLVKDRSQFIENYVPHVVTESPRKAKGKALIVGKTRGKFGQKPFFALKRMRKPDGSFYTIDEIEAEFGVEMEHDMANLLALYYRELGTKIANKDMFDHLIETDQLRPASEITPEEAHEWRGIDHPDFQRFAVDADLHVRRDAYNAISNTLFQYPDNKLVKAYLGTKSVLKQGVMLNPAIHGWNVESELAMRTGLDYHTKYSLLARTARKLLKKPAWSPEKETEIVHRFLAAGGERMGLYDIGSQMKHQEARNARIGAPENAVEHVTSIVDAAKAGDGVGVVRALRGFHHGLLWDSWVAPAQLAVFEKNAADLVKKGFAPADADRMAAMIANDASGSIPPEWFTAGQGVVGNVFLFARNWNTGNIRSQVGAVAGAASLVHPKGAKIAQIKAMPQPIRFDGLTQEEMTAISRKYLGQMLLGGAYWLSFLTMANYMLSGKPPWENEDDHKTDIDTGMTGAKGERLYVKPPLFRQVDDYMKFTRALTPGDDITALDWWTAKGDMIMKQLIEQIANTELWSGREIVPEGAQGMERAGLRLRHAAKGLTPLETIVGRPRQVRTKLDLVMPFTGTWIRRGMPGGNVVVGNTLRDFWKWSEEKNYTKSKTKADAGELIQRIMIEKDPDKQAEMFEAVLQLGLKPEVLNNLLAKTSDPAGYWLTNKDGSMKDLFVEFLAEQPEEYTAKVIEAMMARMEGE